MIEHIKEGSLISLKGVDLAQTPISQSYCGCVFDVMRHQNSLKSVCVVFIYCIYRLVIVNVVCVECINVSGIFKRKIGYLICYMGKLT